MSAVILAGCGLAFLAFVLSASRPLAFRSLTALAVGAVVVVPVNRLQSHPELKVAIPAFVLVCALILAVRIGSRLSDVTLLIVVFLTLEVVSTASYPDPNEWQIFALTAGVTLAGLLLGAASVAEPSWRAMWNGFIGLGLLLAVYAVWETVASTAPLWIGARSTATGSYRLDSDLIPGVVRAQGTLGHPLPLAALLLIALAVLAERMSRDVITSRRVGCCVVLLAGVVATGSRSALLVAAVLVLYSLRRHVILATLAGIAAVVAAVPMLVEQYDRLVNSGSVSHRLGALESVQRLADREAWQAWFGDGAASSPRLFATGYLQSDELEAVDNQVVSTLAQNGWLGLLLLLAVVGLALRRSHSTDRILLLVMVAQFAVFDILGWPACALLFWVLVGRGLRSRTAEGEVQSGALSSSSHGVAGGMRTSDARLAP